MEFVRTTCSSTMHCMMHPPPLEEGVRESRSGSLLYFLQLTICGFRRRSWVVPLQPAIKNTVKSFPSTEDPGPRPGDGEGTFFFNSNSKSIFISSSQSQVVRNQHWASMTAIIFVFSSPPRREQSRPYIEQCAQFFYVYALRTCLSSRGLLVEDCGDLSPLVFRRVSTVTVVAEKHEDEHVVRQRCRYFIVARRTTRCRVRVPGMQ